MGYREINMFKESVKNCILTISRCWICLQREKKFRARVRKKAKYVLYNKMRYLYQGYDIHVAAECVWIEKQCRCCFFQLKVLWVVWATLAVVLWSLRSYWYQWFSLETWHRKIRGDGDGNGLLGKIAEEKNAIAQRLHHQ